MGKGRNQRIEQHQYDEASSSGSDESDSSDEEDGNELQSNDDENSLMMRNRGGRENSDSDDGNESSGDSKGSSDNSENEEESDVSQDFDGIENDSGPDEASDHEEEDDTSDEEDAPLHQRLLKNEARGSLKRFSRRERKSRALEEATKRLATFKEQQNKGKKQKAMRTGDDDDHNDGSSVPSSKRKGTSATTTSKKKKNKHKPAEVSSKRADFFARGARRLNESGLGVDIGAHRYKPMDPRASNLSGHFDEDRFHKNYEFLEELRNREIGQVRKRIAAHKATGNKGNRLRRKLSIIQADGSYSSTLEQDVARLKTLTETRANLERRKIDRAARQSVKRKIREDVESGKTGAYFLKRKEKKRLELEARFQEIRKRSGEKAVEKILAKKRQKNKSRDAGAFAK
mmetsp:Transcript_26632/g.62557  ORF Transcript_26632/g.62557 Transcript_26632/m.62557 type:complete len:401 (+) Transcript_26632:42-1244(+)